MKSVIGESQKAGRALSRPRVYLVTSEYDRAIHYGVSRFARQQGWVLIASHKLNSLSRVPEDMDGLICNPGDPAIAPGMDKQRPLVGLDLENPSLSIPRVVFDDEAIGRNAADHLLEKGFSHFAAIEYPSLLSIGRKLGFEQRLRESGHVCHRLARPGPRDDSAYPAWVPMDSWLPAQLRKLPKPLGLFVHNDEMAVHVFYVCESMGYAVPEELSIISAGNDVDTCELKCPVTLTSIDTNQERLGIKAAELMSKLLQGKDVSTRPVVLPPRGAVSRASTDTLAVEHPLVNSAVRFIWENYADEKLQVSHLAHSLGVSRRKLDRMFQKCLGRGPAKVMSEKRVSELKMRLVETDDNIADLAQMLGFNNAQNLHRTFQREVGMTPRKYRVQNRLEPVQV